MHSIYILPLDFPPNFNDWLHPIENNEYFYNKSNLSMGLW